MKIYDEECKKCSRFSHCNNNDLICPERYNDFYQASDFLETTAYTILRELMLDLGIASASGEYKRILLNMPNNYIIDRIKDACNTKNNN